VAGSTVVSASDVSHLDEDDEESQQRSLQDGDYDSADEDIPDTIPRTREDDPFISQLDWDEDYGSPSRQVRKEQTAWKVKRKSPDGGDLHRAPQIVYTRFEEAPKEDTPLVTKPVSFSTLLPASDHVILSQSSAIKDSTLVLEVPSHSATSRRRLSSTSVVSAKGTQHHGGQSTFGQTVGFFYFQKCEAILLKWSLPISALQFYCHSPWNRHVDGTPGIRMRWLGCWNISKHLLRPHILLYAS
jgi:hypothetical protein